MRSRVLFVVFALALAVTPAIAVAADGPGDGKVTPRVGTVVAASDARQVVDAAPAQMTDGEATPSVGEPLAEYALAGRNRLEVLIGMRSGAAHLDGAGVVGARANDDTLVGGLQFTRWLSEQLAFTATASSLSDRTAFDLEAVE